VFYDVDLHAYFWLDGSPHDSHETDFLADPSVHDLVSDSAENPAGNRETVSESRVIQRISDVGFFYGLRTGGQELGPFTLDDEDKPQFDGELAKKLNVDLKEVLKARIYEVRRPTGFDEVADTLGCTIRQDQANKLILLSAGLLTFTEEDQINILMSSESASGKSYVAQEVASYFPSGMVRYIATASPTAFFHDEGTWDKEAHLLRVDLKRKILIFLDQPHYSLMERLRPLLSHDRKELLYKITDKSKRGALRTKNVILEGYPTVVFCAAKLSLDEQERTRAFLLSPQTNQEKLQESILLKIKRDGDRQAFASWVSSHPKRRWLKARILAIMEAGIQEIIIGDQEAVYSRFLKTHSRLAPRHQRDISRIMSLIKAHALLNLWHREQPRPAQS
jgi:hypothetical protein